MFNHNHYKKVREAMALEGKPLPNVLPFHENDDLVGYNIYDKRTGQKYIVSHFLKSWNDGWCIIAVLVRTDADGHPEWLRVMWDSYQSAALTEADSMKVHFVTTIKEVCNANS